MESFYEHVAQLVGCHDVILLECFCAVPQHFEDLRLSLEGYTTTTLEYEVLWFTTPDCVCAEWFTNREYKFQNGKEHHWETRKSIQQLRLNIAESRSHRFWINVSDYVRENFDKIWEIDPRQPTLFPYPDLLGLR